MAQSSLETRSFKSDLQFLTETLALPEFTVQWYEKDEQKKELELICDHRVSYAFCPACGHLSASMHQRHWRRVRDLSVFEYTVYLRFPGRRFDCERCGRPFTERLHSIAPHRRYTERFERCVYEQSRDRSLSAACAAARLGYTAMAGVFYRQAQREQPRALRSPFRILGVDEIALKKGHQDYVLVLSDVERRMVLDVLPDRKKTTLERWLDELSEEERRCILVVSMDMWKPYAWAVKSRLPLAVVVADRFHVAKNLNECLDKARRDVQRHLDKTTQQQVKGCRWPLLKPRESLNAKQEAKLRQVYDSCPELRQLHLLKEEFRLIFDKIHDPKRAERFLLAWRTKAEQSGSKYLARFVNTLRNWWDEILRYFQARVNNGFAEGINNHLKLIKRRGYGYTNHHHFKMRVLAECGRPDFQPHFL